MKVIFEPTDKQEILSQLQKIAEHYGTAVKQQDTGEGHFIFVKSRFKIAEKFKEQKHLIYAWGVDNNDINFLKQFWGEPIKTIIEKMTPLEFASELILIPNIFELTKEDVLILLGISEREIKQYFRFLKASATRPSAPLDVAKAFKILEKIL
ncbi:MAG: hypothetical protein KAS63_06000 [Candidatus Heimdallarchaeota archaeon]|nr:hypothetical protein [Candidatus Heimdallarchaeota archaeon]MCK4954893.1 hypothetical protein [Candidatus Heimdallarchaeota archaeon]